MVLGSCVQKLKCFCTRSRGTVGATPSQLVTNMTKLQCRILWVLFPLLLGWGCAGGYSGSVSSWTNDNSGDSDSFVGDDGFLGIVVGDSGVATGDSGASAGDSGAPACQPSCAGKACGDPDGCGGTCQANCNNCTPACTGKLCGAGDGCGGTCKIGSGCTTSCGAWQAVNPDDPWDDSDPNYDGERSCNGSLVKDFGRVSTQAACRAKCEKVAATCCFRDHRGDHKSCKAYNGKVVVVGGCTGCTAASCK